MKRRRLLENRIILAPVVANSASNREEKNEKNAPEEVLSGSRWRLKLLYYRWVPKLFRSTMGPIAHITHSKPPCIPHYSRIFSAFGAIYIKNLIFDPNQVRISPTWGGCQGMGF